MSIFFIKKLFQKEVDDAVHKQFVRFSKGVFENKAVINVKRNGNIKISSTYELANELLLIAASLTPKLHVTGLVLSKTAIDGLKGSQKSRLFNYNLDEEIDSKKIADIVSNSFFSLLDCSANGIELKVKKKLPRPSSKGINKVNDKFCVMILDIKYWPKIKDEFLFDLPDGKKYRMIHKYEIKDIVLPKGEKDFEKIRIMAKKKGKLTRASEVDGKQSVQEIDLEA